MAYRDLWGAKGGGGGLSHVTIGRLGYLFVLVVPNRYRTPIIDELERQLEPFGDDLGDNGLVVSVDDSAASPAPGGVIAMTGWPDKLRRRLEREYEPFMLVVGKDLAAFRPDEDPWTILWFSDYRERPRSVYRLFAHLARIAREGGDIHAYLATLAKKKAVNKHLGAVHFKPSIAGFSIDVDKDQLDEL